MPKERESKRLPIEIQDIINPIVQAEIGSDPTVKTPADKIANIWDIFSINDEKNLAKILGISQKEISKIFMKGVLEESELEERINQTCAYAFIIFRKKGYDYSLVSDELKRENPLLRKNSTSPSRTPLQCMEEGEIYRVLLALAVSGD